MDVEDGIGSDATPPPSSEVTGAQELARRIDGLIPAMQKEVFRFILQRVGNEATAFDLTQETFLRVWSARSRFDLSQDGRS